MSSLNAPQPAPIANGHPAAWDTVIGQIQLMAGRYDDPGPRPVEWDLLIADMRERDRHGAEKYGVRLQPFNGRDPLVDLYQEFLDACVYASNYEVEHPSTRATLLRAQVEYLTLEIRRMLLARDGR